MTRTEESSFDRRCCCCSCCCYHIAEVLVEQVKWMSMVVEYCMRAVVEEVQLSGAFDSRVGFRSMLQDVVGTTRPWSRWAEIQIHLVVVENARHGDNHSEVLRKQSPRSVRLQDIAELGVGRI